MNTDRHLLLEIRCDAVDSCLLGNVYRLASGEIEAHISRSRLPHQLRSEFSGDEFVVTPGDDLWSTGDGLWRTGDGWWVQCRHHSRGTAGCSIRGWAIDNAIAEGRTKLIAGTRGQLPKGKRHR